MDAQIRKATTDDIDAILTIYDSARKFMRSRGNAGQWVDGYPSRANVLTDINNGDCYVGISNCKIEFVFAFIIGEDPTYQIIEKGEWLNDENYGTIHRLASLGNVRGVFDMCLNFCLQYVDNIRVDTHQNNAPMRKTVERAGFAECGIIYVADGSPRIAYQLMPEWRKMVNGEIYDACNDRLVARLMVTREKLWEYNNIRPSMVAEQREILRSLIGRCYDDMLINQPFRCDYGCNISVGKRFFANFNLTILDEAPVVIGDDVFIGPNVSIFTACHSTDVEERNARKEWAKPVIIGNDVWIGGSVTILPGVTVGNGVTIGAGSVVTKNIPDNVVVAGNPAKIIKEL